MSQKHLLYFVAMCISIVLLCCIVAANNSNEIQEAPPTDIIQMTCTATTDVASTETHTSDELRMMSIVIYREAGGDACSDETRIMVGNVVMNRIKSARFPNTMYEVLTAPGQYAGMNGTVNWPARADLLEEQNAVKRAKKCAKRVLNGESLLPDNVVYQSQFANLGSGVYLYADGLYFNYE